MKTISRILFLLFCFIAIIIGIQDVGLGTQLYLAIFSVGLIAVLSCVQPRSFFYYLMLMLALFISIRYFSWRTAYSLPPVSDISSFIPGILLYVAETIGLVMFAFGILVNIAPKVRRSVRLPSDPNVLPKVDVFIPTYNEPPELLRTTVIAALDLDYPPSKFTVHVLDDGGTKARLESDDPSIARQAAERATAVKALCREMGANYLTREDNRQAKAGNMNAALRNTDGDLIMVLDADHVPSQDFLLNTVGYFLRNDKLALVQTPHFFRNADPIEHNLNSFTSAPSENEMFYGRVQRGLDRWNASMFCGSAALLSRRALKQIGGFSGRTVTEDAETSLELHAAGFESAYVPRAMISGLSPGTFASFIGQRSRWAQGMFQLFLTNNPLFKSRLTLMQRVGYLNSMMFWLFPLSRLVFFAAPLIFLLFGLRIFQGGLQEFTVFVLPHVLVVLIIANNLFGRYRKPFISDVYEIAQTIHLFGALFSVLLNPRSPVFGVTSKTDQVDRQYLSEVSTPIIVMLLIALMAECFGIYKFIHDPIDREHLMIVLAWNTLNIVFLSTALGAVFEQPRDLLGSEVVRNDPVTIVSAHGEVNATLVTASHEYARLQVDGDGIDRIEPGMTQMTMVTGTRSETLSFNIRALRQTEVENRLNLIVAFDSQSIQEERQIIRLAYGNSGILKSFAEQRQRSRWLLPSLLHIAGLGIWRCFTLIGYFIGLSPLKRAEQLPVLTPVMKKG